MTDCFSSKTASRLRPLFLLLVLSCGHPIPTITGLDIEAWKRDKNGCQGQRASSVATITDQKNKLRGLSEMELVSLLGRPDQQELYKRNQKFFYYSLEPGRPCGVAHDAKRLSIRFNATGASKEVAIEGVD